MPELRKWVWAAFAAAVAATPVAAQTGGITSGGTTAGAGLGSGSSMLGSSYSGSGGSGSGSSMGSSSSSSGSSLPTVAPPPTLSAPTGTASSSLDKTNKLAGYYANPYFQGNTTQTNAVPGGFGVPVTAGTGGTTAGRTGVVGGGIGGRGIGSQNSANQSGILIPIQVQMNYTARMQFPTPPVAAGKIVGDIRGIIDNTPMIADAKTVQVITDANNNVTLRGTVRDDDERRLVEGLVRITPGVGAIKNELVCTAPVK